MPSLLQICTAFGLAAGAGTRATIPVLALGFFHYTPYFKLSEQWIWIASPPVMVVLGALLLVEIWAVSHPEIGEYAEWASYAPALVAGFIAFAAATGSVDQSMLQLAASGILGGASSVAVRYAWHRIKRHAEPVFETGDGARKYVAWTELGTASALSAAAFTVPALGIAGILVGFSLMSALWWVLRPNRFCPSCGQPIHRRTLRCAHCRVVMNGHLRGGTGRQSRVGSA